MPFCGLPVGPEPNWALTVEESTSVVLAAALVNLQKLVDGIPNHQAVTLQIVEIVLHSGQVWSAFNRPRLDSRRDHIKPY